MTSNLPVPPSAHADGLNRAIRTWVGGIIATMLGIAGPGLLTLVGTIHWTKAYWAMVGTLLVSSFVTATISYAMRRLAPPQP